MRINDLHLEMRDNDIKKSIVFRAETRERAVK